MFCSNCGQQLASEAKFCSNCGAPVQSGASGATQPTESSPSGSERDWGGYGGTSDAKTSSGEPAPPTPPPSSQTYTGEGFADRKPAWEIERERLRETDEWSLPDLGPAKPQRRRTWLWILLGMIALAVIACCVFMFWVLGTESGTEWFEGIATQAAESLEATQQAENGAATPVP